MGGTGGDCGCKQAVAGLEELRASISGTAWQGKGFPVTSLPPPWDVSLGQPAALCLVSKYKIKADETRDCRGQWQRMRCGKGREP